MRFRTEKVAYLGIMTAFLAVLSFAEARMGLNLGVPGVKFGLSNIPVVTVLFFAGFQYAFMLTILKIGFSLVFTAGFSGVLFTAGGSLASIIVMYVALRLLKNKATAVGISALGGFSHITVQYAVASMIMGSSVFGIYPLSALMSVVTASVIGFISNIILL